MKLTDLKCKSAKATDKPYKLSDGDGLVLFVSSSGHKSWRLRYRFLGRERNLILGEYPLTGLKEAREKASDARKQVEDGKDPSELKKLEKLRRKHDYVDNFEAIARTWHKTRNHTWRPKHAANILKRLEVYIFPQLGRRPIRLITPPELLYPIRRVEAQGNIDLAHRLLQTCGQIFRFAVSEGKADRNLTTDLRGALRPTVTRHLPHLSEEQLPGFLKKLSTYEKIPGSKPLTKLAFSLMVLTFVRSGELRGARWEEFNWEKAQWKIPAERMKMKALHIVPLSTQSLEILRQIQQITGDSYSGLVFPNQANPRKCMSENTLLKVIQVLNYKGHVVPHGFRSTASTILNERGFDGDAIERQLAHAERDQVRAAYNYAQYMNERTRMMQWWGDFVSQWMPAACSEAKARVIPHQNAHERVLQARPPATRSLNLYTVLPTAKNGKRHIKLRKGSMANAITLVQ